MFVNVIIIIVTDEIYIYEKVKQLIKTFEQEENHDLTIIIYYGSSVSLWAVKHHDLGFVC